MRQGREPREQSEAGDASDKSPTEQLRKDNRRSDDSEGQERTRPGTFYVVLLLCFMQQSFVRGCRFSLVLCSFIG